MSAKTRRGAFWKGSRAAVSVRLCAYPTALRGLFFCAAKFRKKEVKHVEHNLSLARSDAPFARPVHARGRRTHSWLFGAARHCDVCGRGFICAFCPQHRRAAAHQSRPALFAVLSRALDAANVYRAFLFAHFYVRLWLYCRQQPPRRKSNDSAFGYFAIRAGARFFIRDHHRIHRVVSRKFVGLGSRVHLCHFYRASVEHDFFVLSIYADGAE
ncbi:MAG: hypothetical protein HDKAJFGB_03611 [Anaerolineae bacterium]|nr:hypothetical protein [Anaerolineae bacterium]